RVRDVRSRTGELLPLVSDPDLRRQRPAGRNDHLGWLLARVRRTRGIHLPTSSRYGSDGSCTVALCRRHCLGAATVARCGSGKPGRRGRTRGGSGTLRSRWPQPWGPPRQSSAVLQTRSPMPAGSALTISSPPHALSWWLTHGTVSTWSSTPSPHRTISHRC